ncbi:hypothetical protein RQP46_008132 [Phenoliferia psychrophenolica]
MKSAALVCRAWRHPAQRALFQDIVVPVYFESGHSTENNDYYWGRDEKEQGTMDRTWEIYLSNRLYLPRRIELKAPTREELLISDYSFDNEDVKHNPERPATNPFLRWSSGVKVLTIRRGRLPAEFLANPNLQSIETLNLVDIQPYSMSGPQQRVAWPRSLRRLNVCLPILDFLLESYKPRRGLEYLHLEIPWHPNPRFLHSLVGTLPSSITLERGDNWPGHIVPYSSSIYIIRLDEVLLMISELGQLQRLDLPDVKRDRLEACTSYLTYSFPLPTRRYVGVLACQRDPLLTQLDAEVIRCDKVVRAPAAAAAAGGKGKKTKAPVEELPEEWEIELDDTVLFPEGGGQNSDRGHLSLLSPEGQLSGEPVAVREVLRRNLNAVHFVAAPFDVGTKVRVTIDEDYRRDVMCQHTGQHLLSGVIDADLKIDTLGWSLTPAPQPCYIELPRAPTADEIASIQRRCNEIIARGTPLTVQMELAESMAAPLPGSKIPANYKGEDGQQGVIRVVEIAGLGDANPCCGTHYPSLSYLQSLFILPDTTSVRGTNARLHFLVGPRVLSHLSSTHSIARTSALEFGCAPSDLPARVAALSLASRDSLKREKRLREEVAGSVAEGMWRDAKEAGGDVLKAVSLREEDATNSLEFIVLVAAELKAKVEAEGADVPHVFAIGCGIPPVGSAAATTTGGSLLFVGTEAMVAKAGKEVALKFPQRVKGGGKGRWQGKLTGERWEKRDADRLMEVLVEASKP